MADRGDRLSSRHSDEIAVPVLIVGGGPVGMVLAMNLAVFGIGVLLVEADPNPRFHPKGNTHNSRTMEHYRRLGIAAQIRRLGLPADYPTDVGFFTRFTGWELARIDMPCERKKTAASRPDPLDQIVEPIFRCNQMYVERFLYEHLGRLASVDRRFGWRCIDWRDAGDHVDALIEEVATGRRVAVACQYLVGCDGGHGESRHRLGIHYSGEGPRNTAAYLDGATVSTHLRAREFYARVRTPRCWQYRAVNPEIFSNVVALDGNGEFNFNTRLKSADERPDGARIVRAFQASVGADLPVEIIGHSTWTAGQALVADRFGVGRIFLAGDSAHLFTPAGGFGMNTGIDDVANLGWKMAASVQGWGGPSLLATYEQERRPIAIRNTTAAKKLGYAVSDVPIGAAIEEASAEGVAARRRTGEYLSHFRREFDSLGIQLGARYDGSPIIVGDGSAPPSDDPDTYVPSACPGGRAPHAWLRGGESLFDRFGEGFTLLSLGRDGTASGGMAEAARGRGVPLKVVELPVPEVRDLYGCDFALIRPDQHVAWRGNHLPDDGKALIARLTGWTAE
jgi:2-polyprenyl-6-methoxyphenol hydroxylase-like FAD-dependent oxidoreductase